LFFERLKSRLEGEGIEFHLVHGQTPASEAMKQDEEHLEWADRMVNRFWPIGGTDILWQPLPRPLRDSNLVVVTQENRGPVKIRGFCFTLVCDDGPERRGFRTG
jgi:hypothetical protein